MNSYDFDKTIFNPDSSYLFTMYIIAHHPLACLRNLPRLTVNGFKYLFKKIEFKSFKESAFGYLRFLKDVDKDVRLFWDKRYPRIEAWYLKQKRDDDIIISASPEFLLKPVAGKLGVRLIATRMDSKTGLISGKNCHDAEKVVRLREKFPEAHIDAFYSDSLTDTPMAMIADQAFIVDKDKLSPWPKN